jgi:hypothetical protein
MHLLEHLPVPCQRYVSQKRLKHSSRQEGGNANSSNLPPAPHPLPLSLAQPPRGRGLQRAARQPKLQGILSSLLLDVW